jgi:hypothetical protein
MFFGFAPKPPIFMVFSIAAEVDARDAHFSRHAIN